MLGDPIQQQQVVLNLINNAVEAMSSSQHWARILQIQTKITNSAEPS
jgi:C4-dicarboxylate-specific signal transduction histidine kinase